MTFNWQDYLRLAKELANRADDEASQRSAISRAYYAAFHCACVYVEAQSPGTLKRTGDDHFIVWKHLSNAPKKQEKSAGWSGDRLVKMRRKADYEGASLEFPKATREALANAETVLNSLAALTPMH
jgi:uncharacterized protein (UPF0332 family)